ncbi:MAG: hypothetical protein AAF576_04335 [Pseudomonadota bacterium]
MTRIIVHIGAPKCGSTYLQRVLLRGRAALRDQGVDYPHGGQSHPGNGEMIYSLTRPWCTERFASAHTLLFSHELLFAMAGKARRLAAIAQCLQATVDLLCLLRPFDEQLFGDYSQNVKQALAEGTTQDLSERSYRQFVWARQKQIRPAEFLDEWQAVLPMATIHAHHHSDLRRAVETLCPATRTLDWRVPAWRSNRSLPMEACENLLAGRAGTTARAGKDAGRTDQRRAWTRAVFAHEAEALKMRYGLSLHG